MIKQTYKYYDFMDEEIWLDILSRRNNMAHIYELNAATELVHKVLNTYIPAFQVMAKYMEEKYM